MDEFHYERATPLDSEEEEILICTAPDEALEAATGTESALFTLAPTHVPNCC
jgi:hypothetical protein